VNLSLAGPDDPLLARVVRSAHDRGIVVVAATGNQGPTAPPTYPAAWETVIAVSAVDARSDVYPASVGGGFVSVAAPGVEVLTTLPDRGYGALTGTSIAAAHVSGIAALLLQARPDLTPLQIRRALEGTASTAGARTSRLGHGVVDGCRAVGGFLGGRLGC
jgi:subtilisin family serine protease